MNIILGSQSPRRRELLSGLDIPHTEVSIDADESYPDHLQGGDIPAFISRAKAEAYIRTHTLAPDDLLITSDTIVWLDGQVLGKPHDEADARHMLRQLSGKTHQVYTAVTFAHYSRPQNIETSKPQDPEMSAHRDPEISIPRDPEMSAHRDPEISPPRDPEITFTTEVDCTDVTFDPLSDADIDYYVSHYHPLDKAGAYGIQEWIGYIAAGRICGSFYTVMGFPTHLIHRYLQSLR